MKQLSFWARRHPWAARIWIILLYIPLNITGLLTGYLLGELGLFAGALFIYTVIFFVIMLFLFARQKASYYLRKLFHAAMGVCTFCLICFFGNQIQNPQPCFPFTNSSQAVSYMSVHTKALSEKNKTVKKEKRQQKKEFRKQLKKTTVKGQMPVWVKVLLIALTIVLAAALLYVVAGLACTLSCNGAEALAVIVAIIGVGAIIFGVIITIKFILKSSRQKSKPSTSPA